MFRKDIDHYNWCVDTLRGGYMNDTLIAGDPGECGLGCLIARKATELGLSPDRVEWVRGVWTHTFSTSRRCFSLDLSIALGRAIPIRYTNGLVQTLNESVCTSQGLWALGLLQLPLSVMRDLEWYFELGNEIEGTNDERMFNGLLAAIEVLDKYFEVGDYAKGETKEKFVQVHKLKSPCQSYC